MGGDIDPAVAEEAHQLVRFRKENINNYNQISQASDMIEESFIPGTLEEIYTKLANLSVELNNYKELLEDENVKYKRFAVKLLEVSIFNAILG